MQLARKIALRLLVGCGLGLGLVACVNVITERHPAGPPPDWKRLYTGRIVLQTPSLPTMVEKFEKAWSRRLTILGITARIAYDETRAIFDVFDLPPRELPALVGALIDPGGWSIEQWSMEDISVATWLPATQHCDCSAQLRMTMPTAISCPISSGGQSITRPGSPPMGVTIKKRWIISGKGGGIDTSDYETDESDPYTKCPAQQYPNVTFKLPPGLSPAELRSWVLAISGGSLPEIPIVESVLPAAGGAP